MELVVFVRSFVHGDSSLALYRARPKLHNQLSLVQTDQVLNDNNDVCSTNVFNVMRSMNTARPKLAVGRDTLTHLHAHAHSECEGGEILLCF